jgi:hypothetical protein
MLSGLLAVVTAIWYFDTARKIGKNSWLWAVLGFIGFLGAFTIFTKVIVFPVSLLTPSIHNNSLFNSTLWLVVTLLTVGFVMFVRSNYLKGNLVARDSVNKPVS